MASSASTSAASRISVLSFSYCYPRAGRMSWGVFVHARLRALASFADLEVASPVPVFPLVTRLRGGAPSGGVLDGVLVHRPKFFYVPGLLKRFDGVFYARGLREWLRQYVRTNRPDILDAHFAWPDGVAVARLARGAGLPYAITLRGKIYPCLEVPSQRRQVAEALQHAAAVVSVSEPMAVVARELGAAPARVHVVPNGVDVDRFRPMDRQAAREELGIEHDGPLLVTVGHLGRRKGHHEVVEALSRLSNSVRLVLIGRDRAGGADTRALHRCIKRWGMQGRVLIAGTRPHEEIPQYFAAADASVLASWREGCPNVVLESLACGRPVVATRVGAIPGQIEDGRNGRLVPVRDPAALAEALRDVLERTWDPEWVRSSPAVCSWAEVARRHVTVLERGFCRES